MRPITYTVTATDVTNGFSAIIPVDYMRIGGMYGLRYLSAGGTAGTGQFQYSLDNPFDNTFATMAWDPIPLVSGYGQFTGAARAFVVATPVLGDVIKIVAQGGSLGG